MNAIDYQDFVRSTSGAFNTLTEQQGRIAAAALGLVGEAGETSEIVKKHLFHGHELDHDSVVKELGDVMWYVTELCNSMNVSLGEVLEKNVEKLSKRYPDGWSSAKSIARADVEVKP